MSIERRTRSERQRRGDRVVAGAICAVLALMLGVTFASAELYDMFCRATGYNGTTRTAISAPVQASDRSIKVRFDANVAPGLPWHFQPEVPEIELKLGQVSEVYYTITNVSAHPTAGIASYNVQPEISGGFFNKISCFCFTDQVLAAGESRREAVVFFVDPALATDPDAGKVQTITLSYTFTALKSSPKPVASAAGADKSR